ncbi:hypothetical protein IMG5_169480 [Ichthyophthirius multifiliis]|uniref:Hydroxymethylglutaryl-CoA synthase n=1 Tax=Ichthyophthirius multifiliis TaxID=5932 RepID=G0R1B8_ICHMU|nr:hypothetical protein IMG5_169480 [Ichthyophthirius multifiliis]EGR28751.1 hypothetical protein IMG5_169480 [Ichthyophthirius multifiliis]|eukprot:XP_004029987.1 hypothetical protein IMG5_169480 [Ichthyophthirius multifiliis]
MRPQNVGIHGIEIYFPKTYISQQELEQFDKVSEGKYTIGLGQQNMAFVEPYEDVNSLALTVVQNTLEKYNISPTQIGRLEVGTETLLDKSKSTKTVLMQLFSSYGNHDIEGVTTINACYGGTAALFNTLAWVESSAYDGKKYGLVVCVDIAVYKKGPARPTGGAGAICILIGPNAPIQVEEIRSTFIDHVYDFYKPDAFSEFPTVDGHLSIKTYLNAIDNNYKKMNEKLKERLNKKFSLNDFQYVCFHAPFAKMVQKAFSRLYFNDVLSQNNPQINITEEERNTLLKKNMTVMKFKNQLISLLQMIGIKKQNQVFFLENNQEIFILDHFMRDFAHFQVMKISKFKKEKEFQCFLMDQVQLLHFSCLILNLTTQKCKINWI